MNKHKPQPSNHLEELEQAAPQGLSALAQQQHFDEASASCEKAAAAKVGEALVAATATELCASPCMPAPGGKKMETHTASNPEATDTVTTTGCASQRFFFPLGSSGLLRRGTLRSWDEDRSLEPCH